jgi:hypothetical protein
MRPRRCRPVSVVQVALPILLIAASVFSQAPAHIPLDDAVRVREFYRLASAIQDQIWPQWSKTPAPLLLVTADSEFLTHHPSPPPVFTNTGADFYVRARHFATGMLATFPAFGPPSVIVVGEPPNTDAKTSTPWLFVVMHEHFHQLQYGKPGYWAGVNNLDLARGDTMGMWMLEFPFPYADPAVGQAFAHLRDSLLAAVNEPDEKRLQVVVREYTATRRAFFGRLSSDNRKYLSFQLWQEGIARYTQIAAAEAAARYQPTPEYSALPDFESFSSYAARARLDTLDELRTIDLATAKRAVVYSFGAAEGLLLDRLHPRWKDSYFKHPFTLDAYFE